MLAKNDGWIFQDGALLIEFKLYNNYPNPFNPSTTIYSTVKETNITTLKIYNGLGEEVTTLFNDIAVPEELYNVEFNGTGLASGIYICCLRSGDEVSIHKMILVK